MKTKIIQFVIALGSFGLLWYLASTVNPTFFPPPSSVFIEAYELVVGSDVDGNSALYHVGASLIRIAIITGIALPISIALGIAMGGVTWIEKPVSNLIPLLMSIPTLVAILFLVALMGFNQQAVILSVVIATTPYGIINVWKGTKDVESDLLQMGELFNMSRYSIWRNIYFPAVLPYLFSTGRYLFSMIWKVTLLAEVFGVSTGVGARIRFWFEQVDIIAMLAYFFIFFIVLTLIEYGIIAQLEKRAFQWRTDSGSTT